MAPSLRTLRSLLWLAPVAGGAAAARAEITPLGDERGVYSERVPQLRPAVAPLPEGFVLAWEDKAGVRLRSFDEEGEAVAAAAMVANNDPLPPIPFSATLHEHWQPALAARGDGPFLLVWTEQVVNRRVDIFYDSKHVIASRVMVRLFGADGEPMARPWTISEPSQRASRPAVVAAVDGGFWVAWQDVGGSAPGIHLRRLDGRGRPGEQVRVTTVEGQRPALAAAGDRLLVVWQECCGPREKDQVKGRLFDGAGAALGAAFVVAADQPRAAQAPSVAGRNGEFLVVFQRANKGLVDTRIYAQRVARQGGLRGGAVDLTAATGDAYSAPRLVALPGGRWLALWLTWVRHFRVAVEGAVLDGNGRPRLERLVVNQRPLGGADPVALVATGDGRVAVAWDGFDEAGRRGLRTRAYLARP
jgi:hypothetical protein